ncbi:NAD(P)H-hydrate dehydratase [Gloeomargaritales cyanobacterium VI4D9]|nr:NAD(P)H-hydrate dehydratase [Gloeomargaritales cyanobacterium VI4D9]
MRDSQALIDPEALLVTAAHMGLIEQELFAQGFPVAALMEKVAGKISQRLRELLPPGQKIGLLVGPGHNGADTLVVARELWQKGYFLIIYHPFRSAKELTLAHKNYAHYLGIPEVENVQELNTCDLLIDGLFGFGLARELTPELVDLINTVNGWQKPVISIDLPSGLHTDTGQPQPVAIRAQRTLCLGLWKLGLLQDVSQEYVGILERIDFDIPAPAIGKILGTAPALTRLTPRAMLQALPMPRPAVIHKYQCGHLLLVCGSRSYPGAAILAALGARASGVGMLTIAVPESIKNVITLQVPEAILIPCPETAEGAIADLPGELTAYDFIAIGPGLTRSAQPVVQTVFSTRLPILCDADALNILAPWSGKRPGFTLLTPHAGEFHRLFPQFNLNNRLEAAQQAAQASQAVILLKGARTIITTPEGRTGINPNSTPGLARGGSGDVLTGLLGGLLAQGVKQGRDLVALTQAGVWWHAQTGLWLAQRESELSVHPQPVAQHLGQVLGEICEKFRD